MLVVTYQMRALSPGSVNPVEHKLRILAVSLVIYLSIYLSSIYLSIYPSIGTDIQNPGPGSLNRIESCFDTNFAIYQKCVNDTKLQIHSSISSGWRFFGEWFSDSVFLAKNHVHHKGEFSHLIRHSHFRGVKD